MVYGNGKVFDVKQPDESVLDRGGYVGTDPIYQNAANATDEPLEESEEEEPELVDEKLTPKNKSEEKGKATDGKVTGTAAPTPSKQ